MKKAIFTLMFAALSMFSLGASAQTIDTNFKDSANNAFTLSGLRGFECVTGGYKLQHMSESFALTYADSSGVCAKVTGNAYFQKYFVQVSGTQRYLNSLEARRVYLDTGNTKIIWKSGPEEVLAGNTVHNAFLARSN